MTWLYFPYNHSEYPVSLLFLDTSVDLKGHKILFEDIWRNGGEQQIKYDGTPLIVIGEKIYCCQFSQDKNVSTKRKQQNKRNEVNYHL